MPEADGSFSAHDEVWVPEIQKAGVVLAVAGERFQLFNSLRVYAVLFVAPREVRFFPEDSLQLL